MTRERQQLKSSDSLLIQFLYSSLLLLFFFFFAISFFTCLASFHKIRQKEFDLKKRTKRKKKKQRRRGGWKKKEAFQFERSEVFIFSSIPPSFFLFLFFCPHAKKTALPRGIALIKYKLCFYFFFLSNSFSHVALNILFYLLLNSVVSF